MTGVNMKRMAGEDRMDVGRGIVWDIQDYRAC